MGGILQEEIDMKAASIGLSVNCEYLWVFFRNARRNRHLKLRQLDVSSCITKNTQKYSQLAESPIDEVFMSISSCKRKKKPKIFTVGWKSCTLISSQFLLALRKKRKILTAVGKKPTANFYQLDFQSTVNIFGFFFS